jgi:hypothetical protein
MFYRSEPSWELVENLPDIGKSQFIKSVNFCKITHIEVFCGKNYCIHIE